jgi:AraC-like DNA-binding protein
MLQSSVCVRLSTDDLPPNQRRALWHDEMVRRNMAFDFVDRSENGLRFEVQAHQLGTVYAAIVRGTPSSCVRTRRDLADGRDCLTMHIPTAGGIHADNSDGGSFAAPGDAIVVSSRHPFAFHVIEEGCAGLTVNVERAAVQPLLAGIEEPRLVHLTADNMGLRLLTGYLGALFKLDRAYDPTLAAIHVGDLLLSALGVRGDVQALVRERGVTAARQHAILDGIARHCAEPGLDPVAFAGRLGLSVRYLHRLLEPTGRSFAEHLLEARLDRAAAMLRDPECAHLRIAEIAAKAGFSDISHFNRSFRRTFGDVPIGMRARAARRYVH